MKHVHNVSARDRTVVLCMERNQLEALLNANAIPFQNIHSDMDLRRLVVENLGNGRIDDDDLPSWESLSS